jgi:uncharacterized protein YbaP (TraB family)
MKIINLVVISLAWICAACSTVKKPFLWEIEKDGKTSYLFGTVHTEIAWSEVPDYVHERLNHSKSAGFEIVEEYFAANKEKNRKAEKERQKKIYENNKKNNLKVSRYFTADEWKKIQALAKNVKPEKLQYYPAEWISEWVALNEYNKAEFGYGSNGARLDKEIIRDAARKGKVIYRLDPVERMSMECHDLSELDYIKDRINNPKDALTKNNEAMQLRKAYRNGDASYIKGMPRGSREAEVCLLKNRNEHWVRVIEEVHQKDAPFFAVGGVAHYIEADNVIDMLKERGFTIREKFEP